MTKHKWEDDQMQELLVSEEMSLSHIAADRDFRACMEACDKLLTQKGADYEVKALTAKEQADRDRQRVSNFYAEAASLGLTPFQVLGVYFHKHLRAIDKYLATGSVASEPIEGRIHDAINYLLLLFKLIKVEGRIEAP